MAWLDLEADISEEFESNNPNPWGRQAEVVCRRVRARNKDLASRLWNAALSRKYRREAKAKGLRSWNFRRRRAVSKEELEVIRAKERIGLARRRASRTDDKKRAEAERAKYLRTCTPERAAAYKESKRKHASLYWQRLKADPVRLALHHQRINANKRKRWRERMLADPHWHAAQKARMVEYKKKRR